MRTSFGIPFFAMMFGVALASIVTSVFSTWLVASAVTSGLKAATNQCGNTYSIESAGVNGNFFCTKG